MSAELDRIDDLLEQLHQAVQDCRYIGDKDEKKVTDFCQWLSVRVWNARQEVDGSRAAAWGMTEEQVNNARLYLHREGKGQ
jgi:tRNA(Glu) U13 pseudouridine synthase TruD